MKFIHLSDLHLGKRVNQFSMLEDQKHILLQILSVVDTECPDAVLIAGDIYDTPQPPVAAVELLDDFLTRLAERKMQVFIISGNHDSPERLAFGSRLMQLSGIHIAPAYTGIVEPFFLSDDYGQVAVYMLPFVKPAVVHSVFPDSEINSYTDAVNIAIEAMHIDAGIRNVLVAHQFVTGASQSGSEELVIGGVDNVDASVFASFDYVALGHIHGAQKAGGNAIQYCGTPLKYSFSEAGHEKSILVVELGKKGELETRTVPLTPLHDMRELKGSYEELTLKNNYETQNTEDYVHITLTDEEDVLDAVSKLRAIYPNLMKLDYDNTRTRSGFEIVEATASENESSPMDLFMAFFRNCNGKEMSCDQQAYVRSKIEKVWGEQQ